MKKTLLMTAIMALVASAAFASGGSLGLHLNDCNGSAVSNNACTGNAGGITLVGTCNPLAASPRMVSTEVVLDLSNGSVGLSDWWRLDGGGLGGCRNALTASEDFTTLDINGAPVYTACDDYWAGTGSGAVAFIYPSPGLSNGGSGRIALVAASAFEKALTGGVNHYLFRVAINKSASIGAGSCGGCSDPVHIYLNNVKLLQPFGAAGGDVDVTGDGTGQDISYNGGNAPTPTQHSSWGSIKALYR
jgi:parallel beta-helix repeat protein